MSENPRAGRPTLHFTGGSPTPEEMAAVVVVLSAVGAQAASDASPPDRQPEEHWATPRHVRSRYPRSWAASGLPR